MIFCNTVIINYLKSDFPWNKLIVYKNGTMVDVYLVGPGKQTAYEFPFKIFYCSIKHPFDDNLWNKSYYIKIWNN